MLPVSTLRLASRLCIGALALFLLLACRDARTSSVKQTTIYSSSRRSEETHGGARQAAHYLDYATEDFTSGLPTITQSAFWKPLLCDNTSLLPDRTCQFYTAGRWTVPLWERLGPSEAHAMVPRTDVSACSPEALMAALTGATCRATTNHSLAFVFSNDFATQWPRCRLPANAEAVLRMIFTERLRGKRVGALSTSANASILVEPVKFVLHGNSVLRGALHGLIRMLRGVADGFDRGTHTSLVYLATTAGDFIHLWDGRSAFSPPDLLQAVADVVGGEVLIHVEYTFACTTFDLLPQLLEEAPPSRYDVSLFLCNYEPRHLFLLEHKRRLRDVYARLAAEVAQLAPHQTAVVFTGREMFDRFCWNCLQRQRDPRLTAHNTRVRRVVYDHHTASPSREKGGRLLLIPHGSLVDTCAAAVVDGTHTESILHPRFPQQATAVRGQPWLLHLPGVSHLIWVFFAVLDASGGGAC